MILRHLNKPKIEQVVSEITGRPEALRATHWDGRVDVNLKPETTRVGVDDVERITRMPLNDLRRMIYEHHRGMGLSHEWCIANLFRDRKVLV